MTRRMRSTVASGPMPPMMPTTRCVGFGSGCAVMPRSRESKVIDIAKEPHASSGVDEDDVLPFLERALADQVDQSRHAFAGVHGVEQNSLHPGEGLYGIEGSRRREPISSANIVAIGDDILAP